jgi:hypothetical protein
MTTPRKIRAFTVPRKMMAWHIRSAEGFCMSAQDELTEIEFPKEDS